MPTEFCAALATWVGASQALYYVLTGLWPLVSMPTFLRASGPKTDLWLVQIVAVLVLLIGVVIALATLRQNQSPEVIVLAMGAAVAFAGVDIVFHAQRIIPRIYLADAAIQLAILILWQWSLLCRT